jgi:predicted TIM-barrel fold metal-dependent hydrolase
MIVDVNCFAGHWPSRDLKGDLASVRGSLRRYGVGRLFASPLDAAWSRNPHLANDAFYRTVEAYDDVSPVPVLDPTVATWDAQLGRAAKHPDVHLVKLLPAYSPYRLAEADALLSAASDAGLAVICQTRLEDRRRQHPLAQVPDVAIADVVAAAERHAGLAVIVGGARSAEARSLRDRLLDMPNLHVETSQMDGLDAIRSLVDDGLAPKLLFGSHAPFFIPYAAVARVVTDIDDADASAILGENALRLLG